MQIQHANTALGLQQQRVTRLEEQLHVTNQQLQKVADDARHYQMQAEGHRRQAQGIDAALQETRSALEQAEKVRGVGLEIGVDRTSERFGRFRAGRCIWKDWRNFGLWAGLGWKTELGERSILSRESHFLRFVEKPGQVQMEPGLT